MHNSGNRMWPEQLSGLLILKQGLDHEPSLDAGRDRFFQTCEQNGFPHNLKVKNINQYVGTVSWLYFSMTVILEGVGKVLKKYVWGA